MHLQNYITKSMERTKRCKYIEREVITHTSGTPPTLVLTVNNPQLAASNMAMQNASVKELPPKVQRKEIKL